nr:MAG TPA: hypothetical protein [Caudoviricetes sp.]
MNSVSLITIKNRSKFILHQRKGSAVPLVDKNLWRNQ